MKLKKKLCLFVCDANSKYSNRQIESNAALPSSVLWYHLWHSCLFNGIYSIYCCYCGDGGWCVRQNKAQQLASNTKTATKTSITIIVAHLIYSLLWYFVYLLLLLQFKIHCLFSRPLSYTVYIYIYIYLVYYSELKFSLFFILFLFSFPFFFLSLSFFYYFFFFFKKKSINLFAISK